MSFPIYSNEKKNEYTSAYFILCINCPVLLLFIFQTHVQDCIFKRIYCAFFLAAASYVSLTSPCSELSFAFSFSTDTARINRSRNHEPIQIAIDGSFGFVPQRNSAKTRTDPPAATSGTNVDDVSELIVASGRYFCFPDICAISLNMYRRGATQSLQRKLSRFLAISLSRIFPRATSMK